MKQLSVRRNVGDPETLETFYAGSIVTVGEDGISEAQANRLLSAHPNDVSEADAEATESAVKEAQASGVDLASVEGSGSGGKVTKQDVKDAAK